MRSRQKQQGLTFISWLVILIVLGFMVMVALKITPVYLDHFAVKKSLESLQSEPLIGRKQLKDIRKMLLRRLDINNIRHLNKDHITIKRSGGITRVEIKYEEKRDLVGNLSLLMSFDDSIELISN
ncbi:MAG: DUF4845 domain-containing protein [Candidatus Thiodiazotropha sp. (ex Semelilucina semeliformis)]|nr:DUF4845 domain-containing protein [Candidatus Thiodiazotropha sp. (ex Myrtea spinifera)]MCU7808900.1 DUF4845 domain-containing protein [Candidatus Thiodiazotropha sp. (ex Semelilucina semeliformis)]